MLTIAKKPPVYEMAMPFIAAIMVVGVLVFMYKNNHLGFATKLTAVKNRLFRRDSDEFI